MLAALTPSTGGAVANAAGPTVRNIQLGNTTCHSMFAINAEEVFNKHMCAEHAL